MSTRSVFKSYSPVHTNVLKPGKYASSLYRACAVTSTAHAGRTWILSMTSSYLKTSVSPVHTNTINLRFQKSPLWRAFLKTSVFSDQKWRIGVDRRLKRRKKSSVFKNIRIRVDGLKVIMFLCFLLSVKKQQHDQHFVFCSNMYNKTFIVKFC